MKRHLSEKDYQQIEENLKNTDEAFALLALIDAEFRSDPMSVQCFDLRIVERVKDCVAARERFKKNGPFLFR
jgi:hypothetical protein